MGVWWELQEFVLGGWELVDSETVHLSHTGKCPHGSPGGMGSPADTATYTIANRDTHHTQHMFVTVNTDTQITLHTLNF